MMVAESRRIGLGLWSLGESPCPRCWQICCKRWGLYSCFVHSFGLLLPVLSTHKNSCLTYYYFQDFQGLLIRHMLASALMSLSNPTVTLGGRNCHHHHSDHSVIEEESPAHGAHSPFFFFCRLSRAIELASEGGRIRTWKPDYRTWKLRLW